jgi:hypothetical protein
MHMVEFLRDVIIAVAILMTLIAVALHPTPDADAARVAESPTISADAPSGPHRAGGDLKNSSATPSAPR